MSFAGGGFIPFLFYRSKVLFNYRSPRLGNPAHAHINFGNLIPCRVIHDAGLRKVEDPLERAHGVCRIIAVDAVCSDAGDGGIVLGDAIELLLDLQYFITGSADIKVVARP